VTDVDEISCTNFVEANNWVTWVMSNCRNTIAQSFDHVSQSPSGKTALQLSVMQLSCHPIICTICDVL